MENYYILSVESLINTFSILDAGTNIDFELKTQGANSLFSSIKKDDIIYGYIGNPINRVKYIFRVNSVESANKLVLNKQYEFANGLILDDEILKKKLSESDIVEIDEGCFNAIFQALFNQLKSSFNNLEIPSETAINKDEFEYKKCIDKPHQRIFFGAPGTGKSYELNKEAKEYFGNNYERVTFHPNYMYGNFVGAYKPFPKVLKNRDGSIKTDDDGNIQETITYEYIPGVLVKQLIKAFKNPNKNYLLLIEEINRANVAAVFGDVFQLLDRNEAGESEYFIATSKELQDYMIKALENFELSKTVSNKLGNDFSRLYLPDNLYIWATMNSADQGVMPMDTAFRRRWEFKYLGINDAADKNKENFENYKFKINSKEVVKWDDFRRKLNKKLSSLNIPEDKLIGPYFISRSILEGTDLDRLTETIKNKVLMYLYEDAAKAFKSSLFAEGKYSTYSSVCKYFDENALTLFKENIVIDAEPIDQIVQETADINSNFEK